MAKKGKRKARGKGKGSGAGTGRYLSPGVYLEEVDSGARPIEGVGTSTAGQDAVADALDRAGDLVRAGVAAVADAATDDETVKALDRAAGPEWRWGARIGTLVAAVAKGAIAGATGRDRRVGEPVASPSPRSDPPASGD